MRRTNFDTNRRDAKFGIILIAAIIASGVPESLAQENIGYVFDISGTWVIDGNTKHLLSRTSPLPPGAVIRLASDGAVGPYYIKIHSRFGKPIASRECENPQDCAPIVLPKSLRVESSVLGKAFAAIMDLWNRDTKKHDAAISRSAGGHLSEAVVKLSAWGIDLSQVFKNRPKERYRLRFESRTSGNAAQLEPVEFEWNPGRPTSLRVAGVSTGVYQIDLLELGTGEPLGQGNNVWVLILEPGEHYNKVSAAFAAIAAGMGRWSSKQSAADRSFLRASLSYLAHQQRGQ